MGTELQQNRYDQILRRVGGLIGPGAKVAEVIAELFPMIDVERVPGELLLLGGTQLCLGGASVTAAAAQRPRIQLFNPVDSGQLATVSSVIVSSGDVQRIRFTQNAIALTAGIGTESFRDGRRAVTDRPVCQIRTDSTVAQTDATGQWIMLANTNLPLTDPNGLAVLSPGTGFEFGGTTIAGTIDVAFFWRERPAERSELNL